VIEAVKHIQLSEGDSLMILKLLEQPLDPSTPGISSPS
jgi:hypothetical protein